MPSPHPPQDQAQDHETYESRLSFYKTEVYRADWGANMANIFINGEDVGDILVREGLARYWPDGDEFWCR